MADSKALKPIDEFRNTIHRMGDQIKMALPSHVNADRFTRALMTTLTLNPKLMDCDRPSVLAGVMRAAQDGVIIDGRESALVPFGTKAQYMIMVAGVTKRARNSGEISTWAIHAVKENDFFEYELGDNERITHKPCLTKRGKTIGVYSIVTLKDGEKSRDFMSVEDVELIRARSRSKDNGPWVTDYDEMCKKTVVRRHSKRLPSSADLDEVIRRVDEVIDVEHSTSITAPDAPPTPKVRSSRLSKLVAASHTEAPPSAKPGEIIPPPMPMTHERSDADDSELPI